jgi:hypothetical protein
MENGVPYTTNAVQTSAETFDFRTGLSTPTGSLQVPLADFALIQSANGKVWELGQPAGSVLDIPASEWFDPGLNVFML